MAVIAFPMGIFGKRLLLAGKGALKKKTQIEALYFKAPVCTPNRSFLLCSGSAET